MRVALVHDYIKEYGGAERVLETLHEMYPDAPVFTLVYCPQFLGPHAKRFRDWDIRPSILQKILFRQKLISPLRLLAPFIFPMFNLSDYDVVIVSATGAYSPNTIKTRFKIQDSRFKKIKHVCYYHTPPRYLYGFATAREWKKNPLMRLVGKIAFSWLKKVDVASSRNVDIAIANSHNVAQRIKKFYHKEAVVVYPPVEIPNSKFQNSKKILNTKYRVQNTGYYLAGGRLARPKHIDLIVKACVELGAPLKVFGKSFAGYGEELKEMGGSTVEFLGEVTDEEKLELMKAAEAFLFAAEDEDFGIVPVEAMGVGIPVISYRSGGPKESIVDGKTGIFFDELTVESIIGALKKFRQSKIDPKDCIKQAEKFDKKRFQEKIRRIVGQL